MAKTGISGSTAGSGARKNSLAYLMQLDAWNLHQFAQLCCGWILSDESPPYPAAYNHAVRRIGRAVRVYKLHVDPRHVLAARGRRG